MNRTRSHAIFLIPAIIIAVLTVSIYFYMYQSIQKSIAVTAKSLQNISTHKNTTEREQSFLDQYKSTVDQWSVLPSLFVPQDQIVIFIETVEALGPETNSKVVLSAIGADNLDGQPPGTEGTARGHVEATGSWSAVMNALREAENLPYKVKVSNVRLDTSVSSAERTDSTGKSIKTSERSWHLGFDIEVATIVSLNISVPQNTTK